MTMYHDPVTAKLNESDPLIAVVGATDDNRKYGSAIYRNLKRKGYRVVPVNNRRATVDGDVAYRSLSDLPDAPDIVNVVVPPDQTMVVAEEAERLRLEIIWLQPGAESREVLDFLENSGVRYLANACIMVQARARN